MAAQPIKLLLILSHISCIVHLELSRAPQDLIVFDPRVAGKGLVFFIKVNLQKFRK